MLPEIEILPEYLVTDSGTSDGTQIKYYYQGKWYKQDRYGGEGAAEELSSMLLHFSNLSAEKYVTYDQILINGTPGCVSENFLKENESFITFYRLYLNLKGRDLAQVTSMMDYTDAIEHVLRFMIEEIGVDVREYLADIFYLDQIILNEDRHFNNLGVIFDGSRFHTAPIFDNGKSLFVGNKRYDPDKRIHENIKNCFSKAFSGSFFANRKYLMDSSSIIFDFDGFKDYISINVEKYDSKAVEALLYNIERFR